MFKVKNKGLYLRCFPRLLYENQVYLILPVLDLTFVYQSSDQSRLIIEIKSIKSNHAIEREQR